MANPISLNEKKLLKRAIKIKCKIRFRFYSMQFFLLLCFVVVVVVVVVFFYFFFANAIQIRLSSCDRKGWGWGWGQRSGPRACQRVTARGGGLQSGLGSGISCCKVITPQEFQFECHRQTKPLFLRPMTDHNSC